VRLSASTTSTNDISHHQLEQWHKILTDWCYISIDVSSTCHNSTSLHANANITFHWISQRLSYFVFTSNMFSYTVQKLQIVSHTPHIVCHRIGFCDKCMYQEAYWHSTTTGRQQHQWCDQTMGHTLNHWCIIALPITPEDSQQMLVHTQGQMCKNHTMFLFALHIG